MRAFWLWEFRRYDRGGFSLRLGIVPCLIIGFAIAGLAKVCGL